MKLNEAISELKEHGYIVEGVTDDPYYNMSKKEFDKKYMISPKSEPVKKKPKVGQDLINSLQNSFENNPYTYLEDTLEYENINVSAFGDDYILVKFTLSDNGGTHKVILNSQLKVIALDDISKGVQNKVNKMRNCVHAFDAIVDSIKDYREN